MYWVIIPFFTRAYTLRQIHKRVDEVTFIKETALDGFPTIEQISNGDIKYTTFITARFELTKNIFLVWRLNEDGSFVDWIESNPAKRKWWNREGIRIYKKLPNAEQEEFPWRKQKLLTIWSTRFLTGKRLQKITGEVFVMQKLAGFPERKFESV
jgi:hypothetical protein